MAACFYTFDSADSFIAAFMPHSSELQGDMVKYTDIQAETRFNKILINKPSAA